MLQATNQRFLKVTYHLGTKKMNAYFKMPSPTYYVLKKEIEMCLFDEHKQPRCEIRTFWIDEDQDEIEIINQCDYEIFMDKRSLRQHLQVSPIDVAEKKHPDADPVAVTKTSVATSNESTTNQAQVPPAASSYDFAMHEHVECDGCLMAPIMGFRYKCIQCPNYDLCQNCESKHMHSEHMMVRMPTNNCPNVIEAYVTGRTSRRHGKRSKTSCPFVKNGLSVLIDDEQSANATAAESADQSSAANGKDQQRHHNRRHHRRHHRNNFFSHLYEMMHDLAEGGGGDAATHAMGETSTSTKSSTSTKGPQTATTSTTATNVLVLENEQNNVAAAAAAAAHMAAQKAHETAVKTAEIAAKIAHESAVQAANNVSENMAAASSNSASAAAAATEKEATKEKVDATTSPSDSEPQPNAVPVMPSPSLESLAQFLDPQYMKTGIQILNNFSDMFAKMLDPLDNIDRDENQIYPNLRENSTTSTNSSFSSKLNSLGSDKKSAIEKLIEKEQQNQEQTMKAKQPESDVSSHVEIDDLGSDSENDSVSESFIKLDAPKDANMSTPSSYNSASGATSAQTTQPQSLDKSKVMDFAQLSADLKAHIAQEAAKDPSIPVETAEIVTTDAVHNANDTTTTITSSTTAKEPVVTSTSTTSSTTTTPSKPEEKRAVPVYHADQRINNAVHAMMSMGFSNEGAWLTQLLESVNGNISEALDIMSVAQRGGSR